ncbi:MAG: hypothetical protein ACK40O_01240 [Allosphingosinicella sp.]
MTKPLIGRPIGRRSLLGAAALGGLGADRAQRDQPRDRGFRDLAEIVHRLAPCKLSLIRPSGGCPTGLQGPCQLAATAENREKPCSGRHGGGTSAAKPWEISPTIRNGTNYALETS